MIYSIDVRSDDGQIHEVTIDAYTGVVLSNSVETAADEAKEEAAERKGKH